MEESFHLSYFKNLSNFSRFSLTLPLLKLDFSALSQTRLFIDYLVKFLRTCSKPFELMNAVLDLSCFTVVEEFHIWFIVVLSV